MALKFGNLSESKSGFTTLVYGDTGVGKTSFAAGHTHPGLRKCLYFNTDKGEDSIIDAERNDGIVSVEADAISDFVTIPKMMSLPDTDPRKMDELKGVTTVVWDSMSSFVDESVQENAAGPLSDTQSKYQPGMRDYLISQGMALAVFDNLKRQNLNQIVIVGTSGLDNRQGFALPPGLTSRIVYRFSYIFKVMVIQRDPNEDPVHVLLTRSIGSSTSKARNSRFRKRMDLESQARLQDAGWKLTAGNKGMFLLADPLDPDPKPYQITMDDIYSWYLSETRS